MKSLFLWRQVSYSTLTLCLETLFCHVNDSVILPHHYITLQCTVNDFTLDHYVV